jgi:hypothetical protein
MTTSRVPPKRPARVFHPACILLAVLMSRGAAGDARAVTVGTLAGTVTSLGFCDTNPAGLAGAMVNVTGTAGGPWSQAASGDGSYSFLLPDIASPFTVSVTAAGHGSGSAGGVQVYTSQTTTLNFSLRLLSACPSLDPPAPEATLYVGESVTVEAEMLNTGATALEWARAEGTDCLPMSTGWVSLQPVTGSLPADTGRLFLELTFDAAGLTPGGLSGSLCLETNDPAYSPIGVPVSLTIRERRALPLVER